MPQRTGLAGLGLGGLPKVRQRLDVLEGKSCSAVSPEDLVFLCFWLSAASGDSVSHPKLPRTEQFEKLVAAAPCRVRNHWELKTPPATVAPLGNPRSSLSLTGRSSIAAGGCGVTEVSGVGACGGLSILSSSELLEGLLRVWFAG